jgi:hypothetical protein
MKVATLKARNENEVVVAPVVVCGGVWSLESGSPFCIGTFRRNLASNAVELFSYLIYIKKQFYKLYTFNAILNDNAAINFITVQHNKTPIPITFDFRLDHENFR